MYPQGTLRTNPIVMLPPARHQYLRSGSFDKSTGSAYPFWLYFFSQSSIASSIS